MKYLYWDLGLCAAGTSVKVELRGVEAFVRLLDDDDYQDYLDGDEFDYIGGVWETSPVILDVSYDDHWHLVVDRYEWRITVKSVTTYAN